MGTMEHRLPEGYAIDAMTREEASLLDDWAASEGWNPGVNDIEVAWGGRFPGVHRTTAWQ